MKKSLLFACALVAMASCAKEEIVEVNTVGQTNAISFDVPYVGTTSKAGVVTTANVGSVGVFAYTTGAATAGTSGGADYINDEGAAKNSYAIINNTQLTVATDGSATSSAVYYWDATDVEGGSATPYDFYAYYPFVGTADLGVANSSEATQDLAAGILTSSEFNIATTADDQVDILAGKDAANTVAGNKVALTMNHMLSKVDFQVAAQSQVIAGNLVLDLYGVKLLGVEGAHGGLDLVNQEMAAAAASSITTYTYLTDGLFYSGGTTTVANTTPVTVTGTTLESATPTYTAIDATSTIEAFMLLPQSIKDGASAINTMSYVEKIFTYTVTADFTYSSSGADDVVITEGTLGFTANQVVTDSYEYCYAVATADAAAVVLVAGTYDADGAAALADTFVANISDTGNANYTSQVTDGSDLTEQPYATCVAQAEAESDVLLADYARLELTFTLKQGNVYIVGASGAPVTGTFALPATTYLTGTESDSGWEAGHSYLYSLLFKESAVDPGDASIDKVYQIEFSVAVADYNEFYEADANNY